MRLTESELRREIRKVIMESMRTTRLYEEDVPQEKTVISDEAAPAKIGMILKSNGAKFKSAWENFSKNIADSEDGSPTFARVTVKFDIAVDGSVPQAVWKVSEKSKNIGDTKDLTDRLETTMKSVKFCGPNEEFKSAHTNIEYGLRFSL